MDKSLIQRVSEKFALLDHIPTGMCVLREDFVVLFWNKCLESWTNISRDDILGTTISTHFPHLKQPKYTGRLQLVFESGLPTIFSSQIHQHLIPAPLNSAGELRIQQTTVTALEALEGVGFYALLSIQDVTDLTQQIQAYRRARQQAEAALKSREIAEEKLRLSEEQYRRIIDIATEGIWLIDAEDKTSFVNQKMADMLGYAVEETIGKTLFDFIDADGVAIAKAYLERRRQGIDEQHDFKFRRKDGSDLWAIVSTSAFFDKQGRYAGALGLVTDITERVRAEERLREDAKRAEAIVKTQYDIATTKLDLNKVMNLIVDRVQKLTNASGAAIELSQGDELEYQAASGTASACVGLKLAIASSLSGQCFQNREILYCEDIEVDSRVDREACRQVGMRSMIIAPLMYESKNIGVLKVLSQQPKAFEERDKLSLQLMAGLLAAAISHAREFEVKQKLIAERTAALTDLEETEKRFQAFMNNSPAVAFMKDEGGRYIYGNQQLENLFNIKLEDWLGKTDLDWLPEETAVHVRENDFKVLQSNRSLEVIENVPTADGCPRQWLVFKFPFSDMNGRRLLGGMAVDITQRKRLETAVEQSIDGIAIADMNGNIQFINPAWAAMHGYDRDALTSNSMGIFHTEEQIYQEVFPFLEEVNKKGYHQGEVGHKRKDGTIFPALMTISLLTDDVGKPNGVVAIARDITERKQAEEELARARDMAVAANLAKSEFLATMSHEIRTPMNAVVGMTGLLLNTDLTPTQQDFVETIRRGSDALLTIVNDILDFSKIEFGKLELEEHPFNLPVCIEESLDLVAATAAEKGIELAYLLTPNTPTGIIGDSTRLRQTLVNLISNAVKFTSSGEVVVTVTSCPLSEAEGQKSTQVDLVCVDAVSTAQGREGDYEIQFAIKDTGIGIPNSRFDRLFQSFSQVDSSTTRQYGGTGLGLAISKRLSEMMGGRIWVESQEGVGSTFYFTIIARVDLSLSPTEVGATQTQLTGKRVLIVDDNATNRQILSLQAESWGMQPQTVESGNDAVQCLSQGEAFDIALLDMQMPQMDGLALAAAIREQPRLQKLPLIMLTSLSIPDTSLEASAIDLAAVLSKPLKQSQLKEVLSNVLSGQPVKVKQPGSSCFQIDSQLGSRLPLRILLAEDHVVNQKMALLVLERMGYRADIANNGLEVLESLHRQQYDVVLMDVQMPEMDGLTATRRICEQWSIEQRPRIIAMTANALQGDRQKCLDAGMDDYVSKPIHIEELVKALSKCQPLIVGAGLSEHSPSLDTTALQFIRDTAGEKAAETLTELINIYLTSADKLLQTLRTATENKDAAALEITAHTLKSSSASLGAKTMAALCKELEAIARTGTITDAASLLSQIEAEYERVKVALEDMSQRGEL